MPTYPIKNFGAWVKERLGLVGKPITDLSRETGITYPSLSNMLNPPKGKVVRQDDETVGKIAAALVKLGAIEDEREAWAVAGFMPEGYSVVKAESVKQAKSAQEVEAADPLDRLITVAAYNHNDDGLTEEELRDIKRQAAAYIDGLFDGRKKAKDL